MRWAWGWAAVSCLVVVSPVRAGDEQLTPDQLPPDVASRIREAFGAEPLHGRREVEGGKARYVVAATHKGQVIEIFASPDGAALARKTEEFSMARWRDRLAEVALFLLLPGVIVGAATRGIVRATRGRPLTVTAGWLSAWAGTGGIMALVVFNMATVPRDKDVLVLSAACAVWAAIAASVVEVIVLAWRTGSGQGDRAARRRAIGCCLVAAVSLALTIPLDVLRIDRENRYYERLTLRPTAN